jgi:hypothetical protein
VIPTSEGENGRAGDGEWIGRRACVSGAAIEFSTVSGKFIFAKWSDFVFFKEIVLRE